MENQEPLIRKRAAPLEHLRTWVTSAPVTIAAALYGYAAVLGSLYNVVFYSHFSISVLSYYTAGDYLLGGLHHPATLLLPFILLFVILFFFVVGIIGFMTLTPSLVYAENTLKYMILASLVFTAVIDAFITTIFLPMESSRVVTSCSEHVTISLKSSEHGNLELQNQILLGSTQNFMFLIDPETQRKATIVAFDSIEYLTSYMPGIDSCKVRSWLRPLL
jgi:hypothetical protein